RQGDRREDGVGGTVSITDVCLFSSTLSRSCTDIICCVVFMVFIAGYVIVGILAWLYGDPRQVIYPRNSTGAYCGFGDNGDKPLVFYFNFISCFTSINTLASAMNGLQCPTPQVPRPCSPSSEHLTPPALPLPLNPHPQPLLPQPWAPPSSATALPLHTNCSPPISLCSQIVKSLNVKDIGLKIFEDFARTWYWILVGLLIAMVLSLLFLLLLRFTASVLVWILIIGVLAVTAYGIFHCYREYEDLSAKGATIQTIGFTTNLSVYGSVKETWLAVMIILCVVEAVLLLLLLFLRKRILVAIALIKEASRAVGYMMSTLLYPLVTFVLLVVCVAYWGMTALYPSGERPTLHSPTPRWAGHLSFWYLFTFNASSYLPCTSASCIFYKYNDEGLFQRNLFNLQIYNVLGFLWCINFVIALGQCVLAGAFASFYWAFDKPRDIPACAVTRAQNPFTRCLLCCLKCCFWCLEKFIKFLNRNAYIMIAIYGKNFCTSAKNAFSLLMRNIVRVVVLDKIADLLLFFGKLLVVGGIGVLSFFFFTGRIPIPDPRFRSPSLNYYWLPILTLVVGTYMVAQGFFSVYSMCVDTLFLCFLEDLERNDGSPEKPYYMPKSLMKILNKKNKKDKGKE
uniref:Choline transporter-like protein n=1 Tax=Sphenodon punctatus TaxID=8508 RepID=A0A8D0HAQ0_SPHPU